jgi:hypothetical protein
VLVVITETRPVASRADGIEHYHAGPGSKFLKVNSECAWTVNVIRP